MIPYGRQDISQSDIEAVVSVLQSDYLTQGSAVPLFEGAVADYCGAKYGVAVNSATSALHIACLALELGPGDFLWTTPNTFVASANCALYCGAKVDFVDIDPSTYNMSTLLLEQKLQAAEANGKLPKIVIPVHFSGQPCDMPAIYRLSRRYGFKIIEDASHAIGASYYDGTAVVKVGSCVHSDITIFSFHPVKIITTGEGGMAMTNNPEVANRLRRLRTHGITGDTALMEPRPTNEIWNYQQIELGFNYRMTDLQAALGASQLKRLDYFVECRNKLAQRYNQALSTMPLKTPCTLNWVKSSWHLYVINLNASESTRSCRYVYEAMRKREIIVNVHYIPVHLHPFYRRMGFAVGDYPVAETYFSNAITLPLYPGLSNVNQNMVIDTLGEALVV